MLRVIFEEQKRWVHKCRKCVPQRRSERYQSGYRCVSSYRGYTRLWMATLSKVLPKRNFLTFTRFTMSDGFVRIPIISFFAIVTITTSCVVPTIQTHSAADTTRQLVQIHVEAAFSSMLIAVASCNIDTSRMNNVSCSTQRASMEKKQWTILCCFVRYCFVKTRANGCELALRMVFSTISAVTIFIRLIHDIFSVRVSYKERALRFNISLWIYTGEVLFGKL